MSFKPLKVIRRLKKGVTFTVSGGKYECTVFLSCLLLAQVSPAIEIAPPKNRTGPMVPKQ